MVTATMTSKGRITIPRTVRESLRIHSGDRVEIIMHGETEALMRPVTRTIDQVFGRLHKRGQAGKTVANMNQAIRSRLKSAKS
ncbi:MAG: AbrB/MazE/SpoVT family DNA-binding domain-containing protein [bacterium]